MLQPQLNKLYEGEATSLRSIAKDPQVAAEEELAEDTHTELLVRPTMSWRIGLCASQTGAQQGCRKAIISCMQVPAHMTVHGT